MVVILFAVLSVIREGSQLEVDDNHRRVARTMITSWFERHFTADAFDTITVPATLGYTDTVDSRYGAPLIATYSVILSDSVVTVSGTDIPVIRATAQISWQEFEGFTDSITLTKWIANLR